MASLNDVRSPQLILARLAQVDRDELQELLLESYRLAGPLPPTG
ncbi:hypothetical protein [Arthrobacter sp. 7Tela_A1]